MARRRFRQQTPFGDLLDRLLQARGLTFDQFAARVGVGIGVISHAKTSTLNPQRITAWADALSLHDQERDQFIELAWLAHGPAFVRDLVERQRERIAALEKQARLRRKRSRS